MLINLRSQLRIKPYLQNAKQSPAQWTLFWIWLVSMIVVPITLWVWNEAVMRTLLAINVVIQAVLVLAVLVAVWERRRVFLSALIIIVLTLFIEAVGSQTGVPFGRYHYTDLLQPQIGHVPVIIPLAWLMAIAILAYLPVVMVHHSKWAAFAAANGQFLLFSRRGYLRSGGHTAVKNHIVEDVMLAKRVKMAGGRLRMLDSAGLVRCRMYTSWPEVRDGFAKNILAEHGSTALLIASTIFHWLIFIFPWVWLLIAPGVWPLLLVLAGVGVRGITAVFTQQRLFDALFMPISVILMTRIAIQSLVWQRKGKTQWKGRVVAT